MEDAFETKVKLTDLDVSQLAGAIISALEPLTKRVERLERLTKELKDADLS